jgi:hypothetical protein
MGKKFLLEIWSALNLIVVMITQIFEYAKNIEFASFSQLYAIFQ